MHPQLQEVFGGAKYLVQAWQGGKRLYQHVHDYPILNIHQNDSEFAYLLAMPKKDADAEGERESEDYDKDLDFIFCAQLFTQ